MLWCLSVIQVIQQVDAVASFHIEVIGLQVILSTRPGLSAVAYERIAQQCIYHPWFDNVDKSRHQNDLEMTRPMECCPPVVLLHYCYVDYEKCSVERLCPASPRLLLWFA